MKTKLISMQNSTPMKDQQISAQTQPTTKREYINISWPMNICLKYFIASAKALHPHPPPPTHLMYSPLEVQFVNKFL